LESISFQLGVKAIGESKWTYIGGAKISQKNVRSLFPDFPRDYKFPEIASRKIP
jgi:hypothetical protein